METYSSIHAWRIPWTEEPGRLRSVESHRVGHDWSDSMHTQVVGVVFGLNTVSSSAERCIKNLESSLSPKWRETHSLFSFSEHFLYKFYMCKSFLCLSLSFLFFLATPQDTWDLSSSTRDLTHAPCIGSTESLPLGHQGSPSSVSFIGMWIFSVGSIIFFNAMAHYTQQEIYNSTIFNAVWLSTTISFQNFFITLDRNSVPIQQEPPPFSPPSQLLVNL